MALSCCDDVVFIQEQIAWTKQAIIAYRAAILALGAGAVQSYTLDTGQTKQTVTKQQLPTVKSMLDSLLSDLRYWQNQLGGCSTVYVRPAW
jgi:hypothetical protein